MKKILVPSCIILFGLGLFFRVFCGLFVIQPIGDDTRGHHTIVYWRNGLNLPFISSTDGLLDKSGAGVSLLWRGVLLAKLAAPIKERELLFSFGYSHTLYLWTTDAKEYQK